MTVTKTFSIDEDVVELLDTVTRGHISETINEAIRQYFELNTAEKRAPSKESPQKTRPTSKRHRNIDSRTGLERYPPEELTVNDL
jgi:hypothetical protein